MSHRVYLYNVAAVDEIRDNDIMLMEWGYEFPLLLQPLLIANPLLTGNHYNNHNDNNNAGLFYEAKAGIEQLKAFYNFIERHKDTLIVDADAFLQAKAQLFIYLDSLQQAWFHLDAWDVFNMSDSRHEDQAQLWAMHIAHNNYVISDAIAKDNPALLSKAAFTGETLLGFDDFKMMLNYPDYNYGTGFIDESSFSEVKIFESNALFGLKNATGTILIEPVFQEFYEFEEDGMAVVVQDGKYGYVDKRGKVVVAPKYDDAFGFAYDFAVVVESGMYGLIYPDGRIKIPCGYQFLDPLMPFGNYWAAQMNNKWGVINAANEIILPFEYEEQPKEGRYNEFFFIHVEGKGARMVYSNTFEFLGAYDEQFVKPLSTPDGGYLYQVLQHKYSKENLLLSAKGEVLLSGFEKPADYVSNAFVFKKHGAYALVSGEGKLLLDFAYKNIVEISTAIDVPIHLLCDNTPAGGFDWKSFICADKNGLKGVYFISSHCCKWLFDAANEDVQYLKRTFFALKKNGRWSLQDIFGNSITGFEYEEMINLISHPGIAYAFRDNMIFTISENAIEPANKFHLKDYLDANAETDGYYFSNAIAEKIKRYLESAI